MSWDRLLDATLAVALVLAFGMAAAAMDGAVTTSPDEAVDLDSRLLPIGTDTLGELKQEVWYADDTPPETGEVDERPTGSGQSGDRVEGEQPGEGTEETNSRENVDGVGTTTVIDWWQWLLRQLLLVGLVLLALGGIVVTGVVANRHRDQLSELLELLLIRLGLVDDTSESEPTPPPTPPECPDEVSQAWYEMVCCLGLERDQSKTPDECARAAIEAGHDPSVVRLLTDAYQCVRYGGQPVTDELVKQTRVAVDRVHERQRRV